MSRRPHLSTIRWTAICCFILAPFGYCQWIVPIDHVNLPVQNYAVIDLSGTVQGNNAVTMVALDDQNNAAFAFTAGTNPIAGLASGFFPTPPASAQAYTWRNGSLGPCQYTDLTTGPAVLPNAYNYNRFLAYVWGVDISGTIYGTVGNMYIMDGQNYPQGQISCLFSSSGGAYAMLCYSFPPYWGVDDSGGDISVGGGGSVSSNGSLACGSRSSFGFPGGAYISSNGQFTVFYPPIYGFQLSIPPWTVRSVGFAPGYVNNNGAAVGWDGGGGLSLWPGNGPLVNIGAIQYAQGILNDQNQVAVDQTFGLGNSAVDESYLWENGVSSIFRLYVPSLAQWQLQGIQPFLISNQAPLRVPLAPDTTIHILTATQDNGASETMLCTRDNNGKWSFAKVQVPDGVNITSFKTINSSGTIAAIGTLTTAKPDGSKSISAKKVLLLLPVQFALLNGDTNTADLDGVDFDGNRPHRIADPDIDPDNSTSTAVIVGLGNNLLGALSPGAITHGIYNSAIVFSLIVAARVEPFPASVTYTWNRVYQDRTWTITKSPDGTHWSVVKVPGPTGFPIPVPDTDNGVAQTNTPSPKNILYSFDVPGMQLQLLTACGVNDLGYEETIFTYSLKLAMGSASTVSTETVGQVIIAKKVNTTGTYATDWQSVKNSVTTTSIPDCVITVTKVRAIVGGSLPIIIDPHANDGD